MANKKSVEREACERLVDSLKTIRMEDIIFTMRYTVAHMKEDISFNNRIISQLKIVESLVNRNSTAVASDFMKLTEVLCHLMSEISVKSHVKFARNVLNIWLYCLSKISERSDIQLPSTVKAQFAKCVRFMVKARSFSLQITMLDILYLNFGNSMTDFLRNSGLPDKVLEYIKSNPWVNNFAFKQGFICSINAMRSHNDLIISKPLSSVKFGNKVVACSGTWLHYNMWLGTFEFWIDQRMFTINTNKMEKVEMKCDDMGLIFTLTDSPEFEWKYGKKSHSFQYNSNVVEVVSESKFKCDWCFLLEHKLRDKFRYEKNQLKRSASESDDAPLAKKGLPKVDKINKKTNNSLC